MKIYNTLTSISWSGTLDGFAVAEPVVELAVYATDDWLSDVHENQMLDLLQRRVQHQPQSQKIKIKDIYFYGFLKKTYETHNSGEYEAILPVHVTQEMQWLHLAVALDSWLTSMKTTRSQSSL
jgi:hypothetical protein